MTNTTEVSTDAAMDCCVCMEPVNTEHSYISCRLCKDCNVCSNCSISMLENGLLANCPLCRQENWYNTSLMVHVDDKYKDYKINSILNKLCQRVNWFIKLVILLGITWQLGAFIMFMIHSNYIDNMNVAEGMFIFVPGTIGMCCMRCCYKHFEFTRD